MYIKQEAPSLTKTWVFVDFIEQIKPGSIKSIKIMDRDLVLWRTLSGKLSLVDAYCPHMGAHLGRGKIRGELLECLFHKRCFSTEGICQGKGKPLHSYPLNLNNNMIFAWFGITDPDWQLPDLLSGFPNQPESQWKIFKYKQFNFNFHSKGMAENGIDASHFKFYHQFCQTYEPVEVLAVTDHSFFSKLKFLGYPMLRKLKIRHEIEMISENYGACTLVINISVKFESRIFYFKFFYISSPVSRDNTNYFLIMTVMHNPQKKISLIKKIFEYSYFSLIFATQQREFYRESKEVWESKSFPAQPDFSSKEQAMREFNDWYSRFYRID